MASQTTTLGPVMLTPVSCTGQALPDAIMSWLQPFSTLFRHSTWMKAQILLVGAILAPRRRTITSSLRVMGLSNDSGFAKYHRVLSRAVWSPLELSRVLLMLLISHLGREDEPPVFGIDETLERRWGSRISLQLRRLAALEQEQLESEYQQLLEEIREKEEILGSQRRLLTEVKREIRALRKQHGDDRRTQITEDAGEITESEIPVHGTP